MVTFKERAAKILSDYGLPDVDIYGGLGIPKSSYYVMKKGWTGVHDVQELLSESSDINTSDWLACLNPDDYTSEVTYI